MSQPKDKCNRKNRQYCLLDRQKKVATFYIQGRSQWEIARLLNVSQGTISNDLAVVRDQWLASTLRDFDEKAAEELAKLDRLEAVAWLAWERSFTPSQSAMEDVGQSATRTTMAGPQRMPTGSRQQVLPYKSANKGQVVNKGQAVVKPSSLPPGDPRYLERVAWCIEKRLMMLGLLKPGNVNVNQNIVSLWDAIATHQVGDVPDTIEAKIQAVAVKRDKEVEQSDQELEEQLAQRVNLLEAAVGNGRHNGSTKEDQHERQDPATE